MSWDSSFDHWLYWSEKWQGNWIVLLAVKMLTLENRLLLAGSPPWVYGGHTGSRATDQLSFQASYSWKYVQWASLEDGDRGCPMAQRSQCQTHGQCPGLRWTLWEIRTKNKTFSLYVGEDDQNANNSEQYKLIHKNYIPQQKNVLLLIPFGYLVRCFDHHQISASVRLTDAEGALEERALHGSMWWFPQRLLCWFLVWQCEGGRMFKDWIPEEGS